MMKIAIAILCGMLGGAVLWAGLMMMFEKGHTYFINKEIKKAGLPKDSAAAHKLNEKYNGSTNG